MSKVKLSPVRRAWRMQTGLNDLRGKDVERPIFTEVLPSIK